MRVHTVGILLSSPLITAGLQGIMRGISGINLIDISRGESAETYTRRISSASPSLMIVDQFTAQYCPADVSSVLLTSSQLPDETKRGHAAVLSVYEPADKITDRIKSLIAPAQAADQRGDDLSPREKDVILKIVKGLSNKEIAAEMNVSVNTVMTHRRNIAAKLQIHSPAGLTIFAIATGLVKIEEVAL